MEARKQWNWVAGHFHLKVFSSYSSTPMHYNFETQEEEFKKKTRFAVYFKCFTFFHFSLSW
jgi:hypothetical protein